MAKGKKDKDENKNENTSPKSLWQELHQLAEQHIKPQDDSHRNFLSTGLLPLDLAFSTHLYINEETGEKLPVLGRGIPSGRPVMVFGAYQQGKSTLASHMIRQAQEAGGIGVLLDYEDGQDKSLLTTIGVSLDKTKFIYKKPETAEEGLQFLEDIVNKYKKSEVPIVIVVDSVAGMCPEASRAKNYKETPQIAKLASLFHRFFQNNKVALGRSNNLYLIFVNQKRSAIGITGPGGHAPDTFPCAGALGFYCDFIIKMKKIETEKNQTTGVLSCVYLQAEFTKNKVSNDCRKFDIPFYVKPNGPILGLGGPTAVIDFLIEKKIINKCSQVKYKVLGSQLTHKAMLKMYYTNEAFAEWARQQVIVAYCKDRGFPTENIFEGGEITDLDINHDSTEAEDD